MDTTQPPTPKPPVATPKPPVALESMYDFAFVGHTVSSVDPPRFVYSLTKLAKREEVRRRIGPDHAREAVWTMVRKITADHGDMAPLFVDDAASVEEDRKRIITL
jgi:hypothetical protein